MSGTSRDIVNRLYDQEREAQRETGTGGTGRHYARRVAGGARPVSLTVALAELHIKKPDRAAKTVELEPDPLTGDYVTKLQRKVERLSKRNATMVPIVRYATLFLGFGVYCAGVGVGLAVFI